LGQFKVSDNEGVPVKQYFPSGQSAQASASDTPPTLIPYFPAGHGIGVSDPVGQ
jgi:hypothetical protein